ncbi:MAG: class II aldolase/adducin family protein [Bacteroidales bacterium]|nr:class II aldolase/adducin family protein [Bacteroidales bacterium]
MHSLQEKYHVGIQKMVQSAHRIAEKGFVTSQGGNLSYRVDEEVILITPTKVPKSEIQFDDVVLLHPSGDILFAAEGRKPTGETPFHLEILNRRPDLKGLVHAHPPAITALALAHSNLLSRPLLPEPIIEVGPVLTVEYHEPLSRKLADAFLPVLHRSNAFLMLNHGILLGSTISVLRAAELLEMIEATAQSAILALQAGGVKELSYPDVARLDRTLKTRNLTMPGAPGVNHSLTDLYFNPSKNHHGELHEKK